MEIGDCYLTSRIIVENPGKIIWQAGCFEYLIRQQMAPTAWLYSWQITKVALQTVNTAVHPQITTP